MTLQKICSVGHSELPFDSMSKRVFVRKHSFENAFRLQIHFEANQTHFHMKGLGNGAKLCLKYTQD